MTAPRSKIEQSLADRGRPVYWANEAETAVLSGMSPEAFRCKLPQLDTLGFPKPNRLNGLRSIPAILAFWRITENDKAGDLLEFPDGREVEAWDGNSSARQRIAS